MQQKTEDLCDPPFLHVHELLGRNTIAKDLIIPKKIAILAAGITRVALNGIYSAVLDLFYVSAQ